VDTRSHILQVAGEVFAEKGYKDATVREICQLAGANISGVNYHFGDKERLYIEAVKHARRLSEQKTPLPLWSAETPAGEKVWLFINTMMQRLLSSSSAPWQHRLLMREILDPTRACEELIAESFEPEFMRLLEGVRELLPTGTPEQVVRQHGIAIIAQCVFYKSHHKMLEMTISKEDLTEFYTWEKLAYRVAVFSLRALGSQWEPPCSVVSDATYGRTETPRGPRAEKMKEEISRGS
jgi:AcrR family transcriptional regulator